nr:hypothetical protein BaRGS_004170 [Batillaria attramentaria]
MSTDHGAAGHEDHVCVTGTLDLIVANSSALVWLEIRGENSNLSLRCNEEIETNAAETVAGRKGGLCTHDIARTRIYFRYVYLMAAVVGALVVVLLAIVSIRYIVRKEPLRFHPDLQEAKTRQSKLLKMNATSEGKRLI